MGRAAVPSGASTGAHEAVEVRDGGKALSSAKGVEKAVEAANTEIFDAIGGIDAENQIQIDNIDDRARRHAEQVAPRRQRHPRRFGLAVAQRRGAQRRQPRRFIAMSAAPMPASLPVPMMNIINGGAHADNPIDFQEFMILPVGADTFA